MPSLLLNISVDLDKSVFLQMILFAVLVMVMKPLLFDPMLTLFAAREAGTDGARSDAREMQEKAAELLRKYEAQVKGAHARASEAREASRRETAELEGRIVAEARRAADSILSEGQARIAAEIRTLEQDLERVRPEMIRAIGARVLGRELSS